MKTATISELQKELVTRSPKELTALCARLAKYKKENKELLTYLLFEAHDEKQYMESVKEQADVLFDEMNRSNNYLIKKSLRKVLRFINKHIKYSGIKQTELELRLYFCNKIKSERIPITSTTVLSNLFQREIEKIKKTYSQLHEDLQYDYKGEVENFAP
ncbi:MAG: hypothetical protein WAQ28_17505 [Bacteroidia bacterium]|jgi:hypothetical protein